MASRLILEPAVRLDLARTVVNQDHQGRLLTLGQVDFRDKAAFRLIQVRLVLALSLGKAGRLGRVGLPRIVEPLVPVVSAVRADRLAVQGSQVRAGLPPGLDHLDRLDSLARLVRAGSAPIVARVANLERRARARIRERAVSLRTVDSLGVVVRLADQEQAGHQVLAHSLG